jgi:hypothetical protein
MLRASCMQIMTFVEKMALEQFLGYQPFVILRVNLAYV